MPLLSRPVLLALQGQHPRVVAPAGGSTENKTSGFRRFNSALTAMSCVHPAASAASVLA